MSTISQNAIIIQNAFRFQVVTDGIVSAAFTTFDGLTMEIGMIEHHQGGSLIPNKSPGKASFPNVTLTRGFVNDDSDLYEWVVSVVNAAVIPASGVGQGVGANGASFKRNVDVQNLRNDGTVALTWRLYNAFPVRYTPGSWDNSGEDKLIEEIELAYDYFVRVSS